MCPLTAQVHRWILHSQFAAQIPVYPFHGGFFVSHRPLGDQIVDVVSPVLDSGIAYTCARLADDLHHSAMERLTGIGWRGAPLDVVHLCTLIDDDERTLELSHILAIDAEIGLQWHIHRHPRGDINKAATAPHRRIQGGKLIVLRRNHRAEILLHEVGIFPQRLVGRHKDDA